MSASAARSTSSRDPFLDVVRSIALLRVILWHSVAAAVLTYFVAAVPAMFFVTGSLLAKSMGSRPARTVVVDRVRRVLPPLWVYGCFVLGALEIVHLVDGRARTGISLRSLSNGLLSFKRSLA